LKRSRKIRNWFFEPQARPDLIREKLAATSTLPPGDIADRKRRAKRRAAKVLPKIALRHARRSKLRSLNGNAPPPDDA